MGIQIAMNLRGRGYGNSPICASNGPNSGIYKRIVCNSDEIHDQMG